MQLEFESCRDSEVAAPAADRPEKVGVRFVVHVKELTICGHDFGGEQGVNGQPIFADEESDSRRRA
jgi:hypothetical protein